MSNTITAAQLPLGGGAGKASVAANDYRYEGRYLVQGSCPLPEVHEDLVFSAPTAEAYATLTGRVLAEDAGKGLSRLCDELFGRDRAAGEGQPQPETVTIVTLLLNDAGLCWPLETAPTVADLDDLVVPAPLAEPVAEPTAAPAPVRPRCPRRPRATGAAPTVPAKASASTARAGSRSTSSTGSAPNATATASA